jgi:hypothetical protein
MKCTTAGTDASRQNTYACITPQMLRNEIRKTIILDMRYFARGQSSVEPVLCPVFEICLRSERLLPRLLPFVSK